MTRSDDTFKRGRVPESVHREGATALPFFFWNAFRSHEVVLGDQSGPSHRNTPYMAKGEVWKNMQAYRGSGDLCRDRKQLNTYIDTDVFDDISNGVKNTNHQELTLSKRPPRDRADEAVG